MDTLEITNPVLSADVFAKLLLKLDHQQLDAALREVYDGAVKYSRSDDSELCVGLDEDAMDEHSILVVAFKAALDGVERLKREFGDAVFASQSSVPFFANLMAWRRTLSVFRSLNSRG